MSKKYNSEIESINTFKELSIFQDLFEQSFDGIFITDDQGIIIDWNKSMERICGIKRSEVIGKQCSDIFQKLVPDSERVHHMFNELLAAKEELLEGGKTRSVNRLIDITISHPDGNVSQIQQSSFLIKTGESIKLCSILRDVTEQKLIERELREQVSDLENSLKAAVSELVDAHTRLRLETIGRRQAEQKLETERKRLFSLLDELPAIVYLQARDYSIRYANRSFREKLGDPAGKFCYEIFYECDHACGSCPVCLVFETGIPQKWEWTYSDKHTFEGYEYPYYDVDGTMMVLSMNIEITVHKQYEEKMRAAHQRLMDIIEFLPDATFVIDQDKKVIAWNKAIEEMTGIKKKDMIGKRDYAVPFYGEARPLLIDLVDIDDQSVFEKNNYKNVGRNGDTLFAENYTPSAFGGKGAILWGTASPLYDSRRNRIGAIESIRDISERRRQEEALRESEEQYRTILHNAMEGFWLVDINGKFLDVNEAYCHMTGYSRKELASMSIWEIDAAHTKMEISKRIQVMINEGGDRFETRHRCKDGSIIELDASVKYLPRGGGRLFCFFRDITERKRAERDLRMSEERFSKAFRSGPGPMAINSFIDGRYIDINDTFLRVLGYRREEVIGRTAKDLNIWADINHYKKIKRLIARHGRVQNLETNFLTSRGEVRTGLFSAEIITIGGEQCILSTVNDITERRQLEKDIARLERLHLIGEMAAGIGHEIRNPMTTVRGFLQMLCGKAECAQYVDYFKLMIEELDRANCIISEFLSLAKDKAVNRERRDLNDIVRTLSPLITADAMVFDKHVAFKLGEVQELLLDEKEIRQLILNLVRNGLEAMPARKKLTISTYLEEDEVVLAVQDEGRGIGSEMLDKLGTPFFTTKEHGTGLGLAVCYSIAARHNARIEVDTGTGGTTFYVRFKNITQKEQSI
ncbi:MAG TPA: PAS domain S-box protein [Bacillota bacterium]|mgnify:FL=1|nr:PAS domain S-box protein [Peptococcaceae bacterium]HPZ43886.1 PAS domain S-box protein [Bacillota bacterium]HQD76615.1 PAS domain S-box protein [Bacillota bacterium]HUM59062.1 PAS domain S-box protein [Bacillota bacterium]